VALAYSACEFSHEVQGRREIRSRPQELPQLSQLEMLDEVKALELVLDHYAISWGVRFPENWSREGSDAWGLVAKDQIGSADDGDDSGNSTHNTQSLHGGVTFVFFK